MWLVIYAGISLANWSMLEKEDPEIVVGSDSIDFNFLPCIQKEMNTILRLQTRLVVFIFAIMFYNWFIII